MLGSSTYIFFLSLLVFLTLSKKSTSPFPKNLPNIFLNTPIHDFDEAMAWTDHLFFMYIYDSSQ